MSRRDVRDRHVVQWLFQNKNWSAERIKQFTGFNAKFIQRWKNRSNVEELDRGPPPNKVIDKKLIHRVKMKATKEKFQSTRSLGAQFSVSKDTAQRALYSAGLKPFKVKRKPFLKPQHRIKRMKFAKKFADMDWDCVLFTDEKYFHLGGGKGNNRYVWCSSPDDQRRFQGTKKYSAKLSVWGGISSFGKTRIVVFEDELDAKLYEKILKKYAVPDAEILFADAENGWWFQQDGDPAHTASDTIQ
jgi:hypothetical protein